MTHEKVGHTEQGLWHHKGMQLPAYIQHIANDLREQRGMGESQAIQMAVGVCKRWAEGGGDVTPETRAKAAAAVAEWEALKAKAKATRSGDVMSTDTGRTGQYDADGLDESWEGDHSDLPDLSGLAVSHFDAADNMGQTGMSGTGGKVNRAAAVGTGARFAKLKSSLAAKGAGDPGALAAWIGRKKYGKGKFKQLAAAARKKADGSASRAAGEFFRPYPLEECRIITRAEGDGSGRLVEAYAAVFAQPAEIHDHEGHYEEEIDQTAFDQAIRAAHPDRNGGFWRVACLFNHGMTIHGTPAERFSIPIGVPKDIRPEQRGLLTRTLYNATALGEEILEAVRSGSILSQSFTGGIIRSAPALRGPGDKYRARGGALTRVKRLVLGLREYGPTPFPAYSGAEILGVRMQLPGSLTGDDPGLADDEELEAFDGYQPPEDPGTGRQPDLAPSRSISRRLYLLRYEEQCAAAGITLPGGTST